MKQFTHSIGDRTWDILVGTNAKENWNLIDESDSFDLWLHVENYPSGHVIIKEKLIGKQESNASDYPNQIIAIGANYCKSQSKYSHIPKLKIVYTQIGNLKKGKEVGSVHVSKEKYIYI